jgi:hypothetical protein
MWPWLWDWSKLDGSTISIIFATFLGPIAAVQAQKWIERWQEEKRHKLGVFSALMTTRAEKLSAEHVQALNRTGLAFSKVMTVMVAWKAYLDNLGERPAKENEQNHWNRREDLFRTMLFEMSKHLKYPFSETDIKNTAYRPELHGAIEDVQLQLLGWLSDVAAGRKQFPISVVIPQDAVDAQAEQLKWWKDVSEGRAAVPVKIEPPQPPPQDQR